MNVKEIKYVIFGPKSQTRRLRDHELYIHGSKLERVSTYKYLGVTLDRNLNYNKHLENCIKVISPKVFLLGKIRQYVNDNTAIMVYKSMILPLIEYGDILYKGANQKLLNDLQVARNCIF